MNRILSARTLPLLALVALLAGCSTFERDWKAMGRAAAAAAAVEPDGTEPQRPTGVEGRWKGSWRSDVNGHDGGLRCLITRQEDGTLRARYHATYGGIFTFEYAMPMTVQQDGDEYIFAAEADLGWVAGGRYEYAGRIAGDQFTATYECRRDHGVFEMTRAVETPAVTASSSPAPAP